MANGLRKDAWLAYVMISQAIATAVFHRYVGVITGSGIAEITEISSTHYRFPDWAWDISISDCEKPELGSLSRFLMRDCNRLRSYHKFNIYIRNRQFLGPRSYSTEPLYLGVVDDSPGSDPRNSGNQHLCWDV